MADVLTQGNELANTFVNEGFVGATELVLVNATAGDPVVSQGIMSFFSGYPFEGRDDDPPAGPAGIVGLVHFILDALTGGVQTEPGGGAGTDVEGSGSTALLAASTGPVDPQDTLLPANDTTLNSGALTFNLNVGTQLMTGAVDPVDTLDPADTTDPTTVDNVDPVAVDPVDTPEPVETTEPDPTVTPVGATTPGSGSGSLPVGQPPVDPTTPPTTDPVVDPDPGIRCERGRG